MFSGDFFGKVTPLGRILLTFRSFTLKILRPSFFYIEIPDQRPAGLKTFVARLTQDLQPVYIFKKLQQHMPKCCKEMFRLQYFFSWKYVQQLLFADQTLIDKPKTSLHKAITKLSTCQNKLQKFLLLLKSWLNAQIKFASISFF